MVKNKVYGAPRVLKPFFLPDRLRTRLDEIYASDAPLILIQGSMNSGKNALVATWLNETQHDIHNTIWSYHRSDNVHYSRFWQTLIEDFIAANIVPADHELVDSLFQNEQKPADQFRTVLLRGLNNLPSPLFVVIEEGEMTFAQSDQRLFEDFLWLIQHTQNLRALVLTSRNASVLQSFQLDGVPVPLLAEQDLRFTASEVEVFSKQVLGEDTSVNDFLYRELEGHPRNTANVLRGLQLVKPEERNKEHLERFVQMQLDHRYDVISKAIINEPELHVLCRLALAEVLDDELIHALSNGEATDRAMQFAEESDLGHWHEISGQPLFSFKPAIRQRLAEEFSAKHASQSYALRQLIVKWLIDRGLLDQALGLIQELRDWAPLQRILTEYYSEARVHHAQQILDILQSISSKEIRQYPHFIAWQLLGQNANPKSRFDRIAVLANFLLAQVEASSQTGILDQVWNNIVLAGANLFVGRMSQIEERTNKALRLITEARILGNVVDHPRVWAEPVSNILYFRTFLGDTVQAKELAHEILDGLDSAQYQQPSYAVSHAISVIAYVHARAGDRAALEEVLEAAKVRQMPPRWKTDFMTWGLTYAECLLALDDLDLASAERILQRMDGHIETISSWPELFQIKILMHLLAGNASMGAIQINEERRSRERRHSISQASRASLESHNAMILMAAGRPQEAQRALQRLSHKTHSLDVLLSKALLHLLNGESNLCAPLASSVIWHESASRRQIVHCLLLKAIAKHRLRESDEALENFLQALELVQEHQIRLPLMLVPQTDLRELFAQQSQFSTELLEGIPDLFRGAEMTQSLTPRELQILKELNSPLSIPEIAEKLFVSRNTIKTQLSSIYRKLNVNNRKEAVKEALHQGLLLEDLNASQSR